MVVLTIFAIVGIAAAFAVGYWAVSTRFPTVGNKMTELVEKVGSSFKKKDSQTVEELDKLDGKE